MSALKKLMGVVLTVFAIGAFGGCSSDESPTGPGTEPPAEEYEIMVILESIDVIGDCDEDFIFALPGEMTYEIVCTSGGQRLWKEESASGQKIDIFAGETVSLNDESKRVVLDVSEKNSFTVQFKASEWDSGVDTRLSNATSQKTHSYLGDGSWETGSHSITVGNEDFCKVKLNYSVSARKM